MPESLYERASRPFLEALSTCCSHLSVDELYQVCRVGGESELNDMLRHAANRIVRPDGWIVDREVTRGPFKRVDIGMFDLGSGCSFAWVEAKMRYATDAVIAPDYVINGKNGIAADARKLRDAAADGVVPLFLLTWAPYYALARMRLRYGTGHEETGEGWRARVPLEACRSGFAALLSQYGPTQMVEVKSGAGQDGEITLDAWWTWLTPPDIR